MMSNDVQDSAGQTEDLFLTTNDRCDKCQAQALSVVLKGEGMLMFCGHHASELNESLTAQGWTFIK